MSKRTNNWWSLLLLAAAGLCGLGVAPRAFAADTALPFTLDDGNTNAFGFTAPVLNYLTKDGTAKEATVSFSEVVRGNGTRAGYILTHGGIVPKSLRVSVGARVLKYNTDYYVDCASGSLYFADSVRRLDSVTATYEYVPSQDTARTPTSIPGLALKLNNTSLGFTYGVSALGANGLDFSTYGMNMSSKLGAGSALNGLLYFSSPVASNSNMAIDQKTGTAGPTRAAAAQASNGSVISQGLNVKSGNVTFRAGYQDVSSSFNGFAAMRQSNAGNADALTQIGLLEKEKGINRMGMGMGLAMGKSGALNLDWNRIADGSGEIQTTGIGLQTGKLTMAYNTRSAGNAFSLYKNLREADAGQWSREHGMSHSDLTLGFAVSKNSALGFSQSEFGDQSGKLSRQAFNYNDKGFQFAVTDRTAAKTFGRLGDLADADKTALALDLRRQYDSTATAAQVTAQDRAQIILDAGVHRQQMAGSGTVGKGTGFAFSQMDVSDDSGGVSRTTLGLKGRGFSFSYLDQSVTNQFGHLAQMSDFERSQLGNEHGVRRSALNLNLNLSKTSTLALSQLDWGTNSSAMLRQSVVFKGRKMDAQLNMARTDQTFSRGADLAGMTDADRTQIEQERGYDRMDFRANLTSIKGLSLSTYTYNARNAVENLAKGEFRHNLAWTANKNTKFSFLTEGNNYDENGAVKEGRTHDLLNLSTLLRPGMSLNMWQDTVASVSSGRQLATVVTDFLHFETDQKKPTNYMVESKRTDFGDTHFEDITQLDMRHRVNKALSFHYNKVTVDRGKDPSSDADNMDWSYQLSKGFAFGGSYGRTTLSDQPDITSQSYSLSGILTRSLNFATAFTEVAQPGTNTRAVKDFAVSNSKPVAALGLKQVTLTAKYASTTNQHTLQNESVSGKVQGLLGKNQIAAEYAGNADPKSNSAVTRALSFISDRNEKLPLHFDVSYKACNVNRSDVQLVRLYNATFRMDRLTNISYNYTAQPDAANTVVMSHRSSKFSLTRALNKRLNLSVDYTSLLNLAQNQMTSHLGGAISGKVDSLSTVQVGYNADVNTLSGANTNSQTVRLSYDRQVNTDHYISVSTMYVMNLNGEPDDVRSTLDLKTLF